MIDRRIEELYWLCMNNTASDEERREFIAWMSLPENKHIAQILIERSFGFTEHPSSLPLETTDAIIEAILQTDNKQLLIPVQNDPAERAAPRIQSHRKANWLWYAAAIVILIGSGVYSWQQRSTAPVKVNQVAVAVTDRLPGGNKATLTLAGGNTILLDSADNGNLARQNGMRITKIANGQLAFQLQDGDKADEQASGLPDDKNTSASVEELYNTIKTPRGGQYQVILPDGSIAWLNAASSISIPLSFMKERKLRITGEVYFDIKPNTMLPLTVSAKNAAITVLGTVFNVNAYPDEPGMVATLVSGKIRLTSGEREVVLKPDEQGIVSGTSLQVKQVNSEEAVAWKNGLFNFNGADFKMVMRQLERWYDIDVVYERGIPADKFRGEMQRSLNLSQVLKTLEYMNIKFRLKDKTLIVE